jgi:hypothetical protein
VRFLRAEVVVAADGDPRNAAKARGAGERLGQRALQKHPDLNTTLATSGEHRVTYPKLVIPALPE